MIYLKLLWEFLKIGTFTFGGGYAMLPLMRQIVLENQWLTEQQIVDFIAVSESTPGPLAVNMATYIGAVAAGIGGALSATAGVTLPSFFIILLLSGGYEKFQNSRVVKAALAGLRPAVIALIAAALVSVLGNVFDTGALFSRSNLNGLLIVLCAGFLCYKKKHPILIIGTSALLGILLNRIGA